MTGQVRLTKYIHDLADNDTFPGFTILVGPEGSGRKKICRHIANTLGAQLYVSGTGVEDIRQMIATAYKASSPVLYLIPDADKMSAAAKNALLKVTEEPPRGARFIMTLMATENTLSTILSRGHVMYMDPYTPTEILEFYDDLVTAPNSEERDIVQTVCATPGDVIKLVDTGVTTFDDFVHLVVENVAEVSASNSFKIGQRLAFKEADKGKIDPVLFMRGFRSVCVDRMLEDIDRYSHGVMITSKCLQDLRLVGVNKQSTFDMWLLDIREAWM